MEYVGGGDGVAKNPSGWDSSRRAWRLAIAAVRCTTERGQPVNGHDAQSTRTNYLIFRAFGTEDGQEELTVSVLTFGEFESGEDLSERWG